MRKTCRLVGLGCADCAAKIERAVGKLPGVSDVSVNFMTTKMIVEADDSRMESVLSEAATIVHKLEPDVVVRVV